ncbi:hypothetical protein Ddye_027379 [Dipteronia dyeriana]|uniref:Sulfotransferase n=1 Tax=Dipteronia dyeriana TaxID=168575 RepID=A0AAD9WQ42_9ROSI|nr:hypothetical protein Ddye_027379 [Dipteronia dyeriana]
MDKTSDYQQKASNGVEDYLTDEIQELLSTLPREKNFDGSYLYQYQGFWYYLVESSHICNCSSFSLCIGTQSLTTNPHELVPFIDKPAYYLKINQSPTTSTFGTHIPYSSLPHSIVDSNCLIVYMCRNPLDQFISHWHFLLKIAQDRKMEPLSLEEAFESVSNGIQGFGPFWEHVLGYWKASLENPNKILFLTYEDVIENTLFYIKKLAEFLGCPFSDVEEKLGVIEEISKLCSFENMKDLEVNKTGKLQPDRGPKNSYYFRKGKVGDWTNYLTSAMSESLKILMDEKFTGSGLTFKMS